MRKEFPLRLLCFFVTVLMAIMTCFPIGEFYVDYTNPNEEAWAHMPYHTHNLANYKIIIFFCICIVVCNLINKMKWMWISSFSLLLSYLIIRRIDFWERLTYKTDYVALGAEVINMTYNSFANSILLNVYCVLIFFLCTILFILEKKEQQRIALLIIAKQEEEELEEKRKDEEWKKSLFNPDLLLDKFPSNKKDEKN